MTPLTKFVAEQAEQAARSLFDQRDDELRHRKTLDKCIATQAALLAELGEMVQFLSERAPEENWSEAFGLIKLAGQWLLSADRPERFR